MILPRTDASRARIVGERLRSAVEDGPWPARPVTASFGAAVTGPGGPGPQGLIQRADEALYCSKHQGRNQVTPNGELDPDR